ncbi:20462_t:CDS:2 [Rhizophagus irregularis]|nr:20462_t:CDS:2 [Rhizophagus irregularis]
MTDDNVSSNSTSCSLSSRSNSVNNDNIESGYKTRAYSLSLTCKTNDADIEISPLPPVANLNEISIQAEYETKKHENISGFSTNFNAPKL